MPVMINHLASPDTKQAHEALLEAMIPAASTVLSSYPFPTTGLTFPFHIPVPPSSQGSAQPPITLLQTNSRVLNSADGVHLQQSTTDTNIDLSYMFFIVAFESLVFGIFTVLMVASMWLWCSRARKRARAKERARWRGGASPGKTAVGGRGRTGGTVASTMTRGPTAGLGTPVSLAMLTSSNSTTEAERQRKKSLVYVGDKDPNQGPFGERLQAWIGRHLGWAWKCSENPLVSGSVLLGALIFGHWLCTVLRIVRAGELIKQGISPVPFYTDLGQPTVVAMSSLITLAIPVADALLIWRLWVVSGRSTWIILVPSLCVVGFLGCGIRHTVWFATAHEPRDIFHPEIFGWILCNTVLTAFSNIYCSIGLGYHITKLSRTAALETYPYRYPRREVLWIIVDSAAIHSFWSIITFITYQTRNARFIFVPLDAGPAMAGIAFMLINVRVGLASGWSSSRASTTDASVSQAKFKPGDEPDSDDDDDIEDAVPAIGKARGTGARPFGSESSFGTPPTPPPKPRQEPNVVNPEPTLQVPSAGSTRTISLPSIVLGGATLAHQLTPSSFRSTVTSQALTDSSLMHSLSTVEAGQVCEVDKVAVGAAARLATFRMLSRASMVALRLDSRARRRYYEGEEQDWEPISPPPRLTGGGAGLALRSAPAVVY